MKEKFLGIPEVLRKQILLRLGGSMAGMAMLVIVLAYRGDWRFLIPCIALSILCFGAAASLYDRCLQCKFVVVTGICSEIERVTLRRRIKALYLRNDHHNIKLMGVRRIRNLVVGDSVTVYIADDAAVYEIDGYQVVCNYLAIEKGTKVQRGKSAQSID